MKLHELITKLHAIQMSGQYDDYDVCFMYEEYDTWQRQYVPVRDTITSVAISDPADGKEIHLWQDQ